MRRPFSRKVLALVLLAALALATLGFIFGNSLDSGPESQAKSSAVKAVLALLLSPVLPPEALTDHLVRKTAHFVEFCALGAVLAGLARLLCARLFPRAGGAARTLALVLPLFVGLLAALTDETIQLFTARGSQVQDVWLDFSGVCTGVLILCAVRALCAACRARRASHSG